MKFIVKYGIGIYLVVSLMYKLAFIIPQVFVNAIFYCIMACGLLIIPFYYKILYSSNSIKYFWVFHSVNLLNLIYLLLFDLGNYNSVLYFFTKFSGFNLIMIGLIFNYNFYKEWIIKSFKYIMLAMLIAGMIFGVEAAEEARLSIGFNSNDVGIFGLFGLFSIITFNPNWQKNKIDIILLFFFLIVALLSGSKAALLGIALVVFFNYGISFKSFGFVMLFVVAFLFAGAFGYTTGIDRLFGAEGVFDTRDDAYRNGLLTFYEDFWTGHGLEKYSWTNAKYYSDPSLALGPHNAYLGSAIMYGVVFGSVFLLLLLKFFIQVRSITSKKVDVFVKFGYYFLLLVLINGLFETLIVGVNEFMTILFWFFIGVTSLHFYSSNTKKVHAGSDQ